MPPIKQPELIRDRTFQNERIDVDGKQFENCTFGEGCRLIYSGGEPFLIFDSQGQMDIAFEGAAQRTVDTLRALQLTGFADYVDHIVSEIRAPLPTAE